MQRRRLSAAMMALMLCVLAAGSAAGQEASPSPSTVGLWVTLTTTKELPASGWDPATLSAFLADEATAASVEVGIPTRDIVVAPDGIVAGDTITEEMVTSRTVPIDESSAYAFVDLLDVVGTVAVIDVLPNQPITPNFLQAGAPAVASGDELHGFDLLVTEYERGRAGTLGPSLGQFMERWNAAAEDWPSMKMKQRPIVDDLGDGWRDFVRWFGRSDAEVGAMGFISDGDIRTAQLLWLPGLDDSERGTRDAERTLRVFVRSTNPDLSNVEVDDLLADLGWDSDLRTYLDVENQVAMNGLLYTLASYEHEGYEHVTVIAREDDGQAVP